MQSGKFSIVLVKLEAEMVKKKKIKHTAYLIGSEVIRKIWRKHKNRDRSNTQIA